jgi:hypothetical protein
MIAKILYRLALCAFVALLLDQVLQYSLLRGGFLLGRRIAPYDPPLFAPSQEEALARIRAHVERGEPLSSPFEFDPELGWCPRPNGGSGESRFDWAGARIARGPLPREKRPGVERIVAMGDSFVFGNEVGARESWCAQLEEEVPSIEVANLGVGSYGIDQALMRWRRDGEKLDGDEVWLGILPSGATRVATTYLPAMRHWLPSIAFKPRFVLGDDPGPGPGPDSDLGLELRLELEPNPAPTLERLLELFSSQSDFLAAVGHSDVWVRRAPAAWAPFGASLAHRFACTRLVLTLDEHRDREPEPWLADRSGEVFRLMVAIPAAMKREVEARGARFRVLMFPDRDGLREIAETRAKYWQALEDDLRARSIEVVDLTDALRAAGGERSDALWAPEGHYSANGNRAVALALAELLKK